MAQAIGRHDDTRKYNALFQGIKRAIWAHLGNPFREFMYCGIDATEAHALERLKQDWALLCKQQMNMKGKTHVCFPKHSSRRS